MKRIIILTGVLCAVMAFNLSRASAQQMGPSMMSPGYGQGQQRGEWNYCPYCGGYLGVPGSGYGMGYGMMGPGYGMGPGMMYRGYGMGPGMMGYGYGYGHQYGRQQGPVDEKDVKKMMEDYLKSTGNPNLKLGKIEDKGDFFEAEIQSKNGDSIDKITLDKRTGWMGNYMMGRGYGTGPGMMGQGYGMGPGMMGRQYAPQYGQGYQGSRSQQLQKPLDEKEAKELLENYIQSTRNPNLKLGKIEDKGDTFEAEIQTKKDDLVDKIIIDKKTGWMRSAY